MISKIKKYAIRFIFIIGTLLVAFAVAKVFISLVEGGISYILGVDSSPGIRHLTVKDEGFWTIWFILGLPFGFATMLAVFTFFDFVFHQEGKEK